MATLNGRLVAVGEKLDSWLGYRVTANFLVDLPAPETPIPVAEGGTVESDRDAEASRAASARFATGKTAPKSPAAKPANAAKVAVSSQRAIAVAADGSFAVDLSDISGSGFSLSAFSPAGYLLARMPLDVSKLAKRVDIKVTIAKVGELRRDQDSFQGRRPVLKGRVTDLTDPKSVAGRQVVIFGIPKGAAANATLPLVTATTGKGGYFSASYPLIAPAPDGIGTPIALDRAYAIVSEATGLLGESEISIGLQETGSVKDALPINLTLIIRGQPQIGETAACDCDSPVPRSPDAQDFANSPETYSMDLGTGGCVKLTAPNRALEEFSFYTAIRTTDPDFVMRGRATVDVSGAAFNPHLTLISTLSPSLMKSLSIKRQRAELGAENAMNWDDPDVDNPGFFEATSVAHGHLLQFKQVWRADGYSLAACRT